MTPWTVAHQRFSRQEYWRGLSFLYPGDAPDPEIEPGSPALQADTLPSEPQRADQHLREPGLCKSLRTIEVISIAVVEELGDIRVRHIHIVIPTLSLVSYMISYKLLISLNIN